MAVTKRIRFEVLRRDNHACRYCGATAPDVKITVDHVLPVALGGTDEPTNLVACCAPCNSGKTSTSPGEHLVADVDSDAIRWAAARKRAAGELKAARAKKTKQTNVFLKSWQGWDKDGSYLPPDWRESIAMWLSDGLEMDDIDECLGIALGKRHISCGQVFRYMAGIVRNKIAELDKATRAILAEADDPEEEDDGFDEAVDASVEAYWRGRADGYQIGWREGQVSAAQDLETTYGS